MKYFKYSTSEVSFGERLSPPIPLLLPLRFSLAFSTTAVNALASVKGTEPFSSDRRTLEAITNRPHWGWVSVTLTSVILFKMLSIELLFFPDGRLWPGQVPALHYEAPPGGRRRHRRRFGREPGGVGRGRCSRRRRRVQHT